MPSGKAGDGYKYSVGSTKTDMPKFIKEANKALNGRGGGRGDIMQGSFSAAAADIERYLKDGLA